MENNFKKIYVYENFSSDIPVYIGSIFCENKRGNYYYSFEFDDEIVDMAKYSQEIFGRDIMYAKGRQYANVANKIFGIFSDASPDRWGRTLIDKKFNSEDLTDYEYLTNVSDMTRMGALRFKYDKDGDFIDNSPSSIPPIAKLRTLEDAARNLENNEIDPKSIDLLSPSSSLGGARPKATVIDENGVYYIAKFPSKNDLYDVCAFEYVMHKLMKKCGILTPDVRLEVFSKYGSTLLVKRFDRVYNNHNEVIRRRHNISAMSALGRNDGAHGSYLDIAYFVKKNSTDPNADLLELFKRVAFNIVVKNVDDHLRNHSFVYDGDKLSLSQVYDVNPTHNAKKLTLLVDERSNELSLDNLVSTAKYYNIANDVAYKIVSDIKSLVKSDFEKECKMAAIPRSQIELFRGIYK